MTRGREGNVGPRVRDEKRRAQHSPSLPFPILVVRLPYGAVPADERNENGERNL